MQVRAFLEREVRPIVNDYRDRAEFPHQIIQSIADLGLFGMQIAETARFENSSVFRGWVALETGRVDGHVRRGAERSVDARNRPGRLIGCCWAAKESRWKGERPGTSPTRSTRWRARAT
ncbi:hypothetical protein GCM10022223_53380 [Kineosporia mesophila]|uniref:Acyl-CoA dehydrogenase/oxidase N-terminal domain-containing protein n=1 Tax=Kineosporia mesophila TaxID=566012 RepID=A0ABP7ACG3_9ACTN|nr:acyl-CoA dehydrogenase family protein [Kineosporia mesophila]MCD5351279.1 acyl-CoA dehydrogenase family protein [Kineosporia mesophila]